MYLINRHIVLLLYYNIQETPACISAGRGLAVLKWNPRTRELTVIYDAKVTSARHIMHFMA